MVTASQSSTAPEGAEALDALTPEALRFLGETAPSTVEPILFAMRKAGYGAGIVRAIEAGWATGCVPDNAHPETLLIDRAKRVLWGEGDGYPAPAEAIDAWVRELACVMPLTATRFAAVALSDLWKHGWTVAAGGQAERLCQRFSRLGVRFVTCSSALGAFDPICLGVVAGDARSVAAMLPDQHSMEGMPLGLVQTVMTKAPAEAIDDLLEHIRAHCSQERWSAETAAAAAAVATRVRSGGASVGFRELMCLGMDVGVPADVARALGSGVVRVDPYEYDQPSTKLHLTHASVLMCEAESPFMRQRALRLAGHAIHEFGADVNALSADGFTPLHFAVSSNSAAATSLLLEAGAAVTARELKRTDRPEALAAIHAHMARQAAQSALAPGNSAASRP